MEEIQISRDKDLDYYRGLIMIYIIGVIHCLYWTGFIYTTYKSFLLIEMPIIFFITGASNSFKNKGLLEFYGSRLKRILIPYLIFALICWIVSIIANYYFLQVNPLKYIETNNFSSLLSWLNPFGNHITPLKYLNWHVWFIPIYLLVIILFPLYKYLYNFFIKINRNLAYIPLAVIFIIFILVNIFTKADEFCYVKQTIFYSFWTYLGIFYIDFKENALSKWKIFCISLVAFLVTYLLISRLGFSIDMQINKAPPNVVFLMYNIGCFGLIVLIKDYILKIVNIPFFKAIVNDYSKYGYTIYLYQAFSFLILTSLLNRLGISFYYHNKILGLLVYFIIAIIMGLIYPKIFGFIETGKIKLNKKNKYFEPQNIKG